MKEVDGANRFENDYSIQQGPESNKKIWIIVGIIFGVIVIIFSIFLFMILSQGKISDDELLQGISISLKEDKEIKFEINEEEHKIIVDSVYEDSVDIIIQSETIRINIKIDEIKKFDLGSDGTYDLQIKLESIENGVPNIFIKKIDEIICTESWDCTNWEECVNDMQTRACTDLNNCRTEENKPIEIQDCGVVEVEENISSCSAQSGIICNQTSSFDEENEFETDNFCYDYYQGTIVDGFCYTDTSKTLVEPDAEDGILTYIPYGSEVERTIEYPTSVEIVDNGVSFNIKIILENKGSQLEQITFNNFKMKIYDLEDMQIQTSETVQPREIKEIDLSVNLPESVYNWGPESFITFWDNYQDHTEGKTLPRIILYWDYDPYRELPVSVEECGSRKYVDNSGVCIEDILYLSIAQRSCSSDEDCTDKYPYLGGNYKCYEYSCLDMGSEYIVFDQESNYKVAILPVYVSDDDTEYNNMKQKVEEQLDFIIPKMDKWFLNEKEYWKTDSELQLEFNAIDGNCRMSFAEFENIHPVQGSMHESELREIEDECIPNKNYDFLIISIQREDYFNPSFQGVGINYRTIISSQLNSRTIIHEILHSFGEHDIYGVESYQWGNCYLYNANTGHNWNEDMPHLCKFEAMQLGWYPKFPN